MTFSEQLSTTWVQVTGICSGNIALYCDFHLYGIILMQNESPSFLTWFPILFSMLFFVQMSRSCYRCLNDERLRVCNTFWCRNMAKMVATWDQFKISMYQIFLWLWWSPAGRFIRINALE